MPFSGDLTRRSLYLLLTILLVGFILRVYKLDSHGIFLDEKYTMIISQGIVMEGANQIEVFSQPTFTPSEFWKPKTLSDFFEAITRGDIGNSPAYYAVVHSWMRVFGLSDFSARFPSVLFSTFTILLLFAFVNTNFNSVNLALLSSGIAAIEPMFIAYSHQARNYSMSFFLTLLATHLFLKIIHSENKNATSVKLYVWYSITIALCLLSHFLTFTVFLGHGLYVLLFFRKTRGWVGLVVSIVAGIIPMVLWMTYGGGQYTLSTLQYQADLYRRMALEQPFTNPYGIILPATLQTVFAKSIPMISDLFIFTNGLHDILEGKKLVIFSLLVGGLITFVYNRSLNNPVFKKYGWLIVSVILALSLVVYPRSEFSFALLSASVLLFYLMFRYIVQADKQIKPILWFIVIMAMVPNLFLIVWAFRNGHTYGLTQRYGGFSFPYSIILVSIALWELFKSESTVRYPIFVLLLVQAYFVTNLLATIFQDRSPKYTYFATPRGLNPYYTTAQKIKQQYEEGDTIKYPTKKNVFMSEMDRTYFSYSIEDAQLTNLYLPKDATYLQKIDTTELNKIVLIKGDTGKEKVLFDFEGRKHRY